MNSKQIAERLVSLCRDTKWETAQKELYADDAVSIEAESGPAFEKETKGLPAIMEKGRKFNAMIEKFFGITVSEPLVTDSSIAFTMSMDVKMKGQDRMTMSELCVYEVKEGKIVSEQFHQ